MATMTSQGLRSARSGAHPPENQRALAALARDAALARIGRVRVLMLVAAVVLTALLTALASALLPGRSLGAARRGSTATGARSAAPRVSSRRSAAVAPPMPAAAGPAQLGLEGPAQAPQSAPPPPAASAPVQPAPAPSGGGAVVSGGS